MPIKSAFYGSKQLIKFAFLSKLLGVNKPKMWYYFRAIQPRVYTDTYTQSYPQDHGHQK